MYKKYSKTLNIETTSFFENKMNYKYLIKKKNNIYNNACKF